MKLAAEVRRVTGATQHLVGRTDNGNLVADSELPAAHRVEIESGKAGDEGFCLNRYDVQGRFAGDTWHLTLEEAMEQAEFEFEIPPDGWEVVAEDEEDAATA